MRIWIWWFDENPSNELGPLQELIREARAARVGTVNEEDEQQGEEIDFAMVQSVE